MKKRILIMAICAIIAMGFATQLNAQTVYYAPDATGGRDSGGAGDLASNTNIATAGIFTNDVDDFISYHDYSGVLQGTKWFTFLTGKNIWAGALDAGYATNIGGIYLGVWYRGNVFRTNPNAVVETNTITPVYNDTHDILNQLTYTTQYNNAVYNETTNNIEFLIGVAGQGIKVGFFETTSSNKNEGSTGRNVIVIDYLDGRKEYTNAIDEYKRSTTYLKPYLGWGSTFKIGDMSLRPFVDIGFGIYDNTVIDNYSSFEEYNGTRYDVVNTIGAGNNTGFLLPNGKIGAWLDLAKKESVQQSIGISYAINLYLYNSDAGLLGNVDGTAAWAAGQINRVTDYANRTVTTTDITYTIYERTYISHTITPEYTITGEPSENFKLGFSAALPVYFTSMTTDQYTKLVNKTATSYKNGQPGNVNETNTLTYANNGNNETSTLGVNLELAVGASYQLIPNRFGINAGISAAPVRFSQTVTKRLPRTTQSISTTVVTQDDGSVTTNSKTVTLKTEADQVTSTNYWQQYTATLYGGFTFNFNEHAALDLGASSSSGSTNAFNLNLTTVNVIFTVKY